MPRFIKNTLIRSGNPIVAKIISVGKNVISSAEVSATFSLFVISRASLYVRIIFRSENKKGKTIVANSVLPKIIMEIDVNPIKPNLNGNTG